VDAPPKLAGEQLVIVRAESVVWNDGSLGCPEPGMDYTQAPVKGYWVVINAAGQTYDFRVGRGGNFRCVRLAVAVRHQNRMPVEASSRTRLLANAVSHCNGERRWVSRGKVTFVSKVPLNCCDNGPSSARSNTSI
jgi:hypothetical protein